MRRSLMLIVLLLVAVTPASFSQTRSNYAGEEMREIKALSAEEIEGYLAGRGMGFARAAELNHYPGPMHVLQLAEALGLSDEQRRQTQMFLDAMHAEAVALGTELVDIERRMDSLLAAGSITQAQLDELVAASAAVRGRLRAAHLRAHLAQREVLSPEQVRRYDELRGYTGSDSR